MCCPEEKIWVGCVKQMIYFKSKSLFLGVANDKTVMQLQECTLLPCPEKKTLAGCVDQIPVL